MISRNSKEELDSKVKILLYRIFRKAGEFKCMQSDAGSRLMFQC